MDISKIFQLAVEKKASDIHLVVSLAPILRIDGQLHYVEEEGKVENAFLNEALRSLLNDKQLKDFNENKDLDFGLDLGGNRFRVNLSYERGNIKLVARVINQELPTLESINAPQIMLELLKQERGLILITGPTGCGKSTTLAAMINYINNNFYKNIVTLEDPIEYIFESKKSVITQRELGIDVSSFATGLKHVLRQDPNIVMVGELRDLDTISAAITLAETGHLVLATLHTYSAAQTVDRMIDIFPPHQQNQIRLQLSMVLSAVISQRLLPKLGGGRVAAREVLIKNDAVANLIRESKTAQLQSVLQTGYSQGMNTMELSVQSLCENRLISQETMETVLQENNKKNY